MTLHRHPIPPVPESTAAAVHAAFPKGNLYVDLRAEFGTLYTDQLFTDLYPPLGRAVAVPPWRLALVLVMQYIEGLTDRQAAAAVRTLHRLACVLETMHAALNELATLDPDWVRSHVPFEWYERYGMRAETSRLPKETTKCEALARMIGADAYYPGYHDASNNP